MTIKDYIESAKTLESIAKKYLGEYWNLYTLERYESGNIEFSIPNFKLRETLEIVPDETNDFITYIQFCYCHNEWNPCMYNRIQNVGIYKKHKGWSKESEDTE
jgi:hypothetical protein